MSHLILAIARSNRFLAGFIIIIGRIFLSEHDQNVLRWKLIDGDKTFRINYPLNSNSIVFDVGGYKGDSTIDIYKKYGSNIFVFEPVKEYYQILKSRFKNFKKIHVFDYGLSNKTERLNIHLLNDASSIYGESGKLEKVKLIDVKDVLIKNKIDFVDLMELNIEGGEYALLEHLIDKDLVKKFKNIQVQFHDSMPQANKRRTSIQESLRETHILTYNYPFVWENWKLKANNYENK